MRSARSVVSRLLSIGVLSAAWSSILTGLAMLYVAYLLGSVSDDDAAALPVALVLAVTGVWQLERGVRAELRRRRGSTAEPS